MSQSSHPGQLIILHPAVFRDKLNALKLPRIACFQPTRLALTRNLTRALGPVIIFIGVKTERWAVAAATGQVAVISSEVRPMKEIRGAAAVRYASEMNIFFDIDEDFLAGAEEEMREQRTSMSDVDELIKERTGHSYDPAEIVPGKPIFDFLINRYGDGWIYVALEGNNPKAEERVALRMYRRLLGEPDAVSLIDVKGLFAMYSRTRFGDTGFSRDADLNLLFHAVLRLAGKGMLECVADEEPLPASETASYGRQRFGLPPDVEVLLANVLCERCRRECSSTSMRLHAECARRLRQVLGKTTARPATGHKGQKE